MNLKGITTVFSHKKWIYSYLITGMLYQLINSDKLDGAQFMMGLMALIPITIGASSFDKSKWRVNDDDKNSNLPKL